MITKHFIELLFKTSYTKKKKGVLLVQTTEITDTYLTARPNSRLQEMKAN